MWWPSRAQSNLNLSLSLSLSLTNSLSLSLSLSSATHCLHQTTQSPLVMKRGCLHLRASMIQHSSE